MSPSGDLIWIEEHLSRGLAGVPFGGAALAVVAGGEAHVAVLGEASPGRPVDAATPFHVCSCAKMFTAAVASGLAADGAFAWDDPVSKVVPELRFADPAITARCSFRDLAGMRVGLTRDGVAEWGFRQDAAKSERLARASHMAFVAPFRDRFTYSNLCYIALALAAERIAGRTYADLLEEMICRPLGLYDSWSESGGDAHRTPAAPYMPFDGVARPVAELTGFNSEGSARVHLSARDASRWIAFLLAAAAGSDAGPLSPAIVEAMISPQSVIRDPDRRLAPWGGNIGAYGLGLSLTHLRGRRLVRHGGGGRGWRHAIALAPEAGAGVMLMVSAESPRIEGLALEILDRLTGGTAPFADIFERAAQRSAELARRTTPTEFEARHAPAQLISPGVYANLVTGAVHLTDEGGRVRFQPVDAPIFAGEVVSLGGAVHEVRFDELALSPQPLDPLFRLNSADPDALETTYWGRLRRLA